MSKKGMKRPEITHKGKNKYTPSVPELQGKAKVSSKKTNPIIAGTASSVQRVYHSKPHKNQGYASTVYPEYYNELATDNLTNDIPSSDLKNI